ncbi:MAG: DUF2905 domain-containing protein [Candidatus Omnitrophota bacterium]|jgi:hypothetical protein|nr:MAG: DUF2905 domain-containing protein [Candidatus Omnitrophota bacterium]
MQEISKTLIFFGAVFLVVGLLLGFINRVPFLGKLPGDMYIQKKNFSVYFPLATSLLLSILISMILRIWPRR